MSADVTDTASHCDRCKSDRLASVNAKCSDLCCVYMANNDREHDGYVPGDMGIGGGDYVCFTWCLACGKIQDDENEFPYPLCQLEGASES